MSIGDPAATEPQRLGTPFSTAAEVAVGEEAVLPLIEETARIDKRAVETGRVRIATRTESIDQVLRKTLRSDMVGVTRVPVSPPPRGSDRSPDRSVPHPNPKETP